MKKLILFVCTGVLVLGLTACGKGATEDNLTSGASQETSQEESSEETSENTSAEESSDTEPGDIAGGGEEAAGWSEEMTALRSAVVEAVGQDNYWPDMPMEADMLETFFGITSDLYEDYMAESPMISANVDTLVIVKAKEEQADAVLEILNGYRENLVNDTMQYPQNLGKIQASQVEKIGNYVIFVQLGGGAIESGDEEEVLTKCQEANKLALDAIRSNVEG
jgi:hypothetical protein